MATTAVETALLEIEERLATFAPQHLGLQGLQRLPLRTETLEQVRLLSGKFDQRVAALNVAKVALTALMADGHPTLSTVSVTALILEDLRVIIASFEAAMLLFVANEPAAGLNLKVGTPTPKT